MSPVWTSRLVLCALVLLGVTGCADPVIGDPPICNVAPSPDPAEAHHPGLMKVGQKFTLAVVPLPPPPCSAEPTSPSSVTAEIEGPGGEPLEGQIQLGAPGGPATLEFTPVRPGPHHIVVAFSRVGGLHQFDFHAAVDSSTTAPSYTLNRPCTSLQRTQRGAWVCDTVVLRGDTVIATFPNTRLAVAGDVIWAVSGWDVHRYVDTGSSLVLTGALSQPEGDGTFLLPSEDELVVVHGTTMAFYTFSGGTLSTAGATTWDRPWSHMGLAGPFGLFLREGNQLALVARRPNGTGTGTEIEVCPYQFVSGQLQPATGTCTRLPGEVAGFEPRVLWTLEPAFFVGNRREQGILHRWEWVAGRLVEQGSVSLGVHARLAGQMMINPSIVPVIHASSNGEFRGTNTAVAFWSAERRTILFEHLDAEVIQTNASPTFYSGVTAQAAPTRVTKVRLRSQAPIR